MFEGFFQLGFVGRDLDASMAALGERYGVRRFAVREIYDWLRIGLAWVGDTQIEVIVAEPGHMPLYDPYKPEAAEAVRLHHHGYLIKDEAHWDRVESKIAANGLERPVAFRNAMPGLDMMYVDTRADLGVYSEYIYLYGEGLRFFDDVPRNG